MSHSSSNAPLSVSLLALPQSTPATLHALLEVFAAVGVAWTELTGEVTRARPIDARIVAGTEKPFPSPVGVSISPQRALEEVRSTDLIIVTDLAMTAGFDPRGLWKKEAKWVRRHFAEGATLASVCTGSLFLAETGLLDGLETTSHWSALQIFRRHYPAVVLRGERILCPAGPGHRIITSGGASSWGDLALALIARFCGEEEALRIAKIFVMGDRSAGQLPFAAMGRPQRHDDAVIALCQEWIAEHYRAANPVARMVARSGLTERTFKRRFKAATGYTPVDYVQALRIEEAKHLLETTGEPTDAVAALVGYGDPAFFRRLFKRRTGVTPARYRRQFQPIVGWRPEA